MIQKFLRSELMSVLSHSKLIGTLQSFIFTFSLSLSTFCISIPRVNLLLRSICCMIRRSFNFYNTHRLIYHRRGYISILWYLNTEYFLNSHKLSWTKCTLYKHQMLCYYIQLVNLFNACSISLYSHILFENHPCTLTLCLLTSKFVIFSMNNMLFSGFYLKFQYVIFAFTQCFF